MELEYIENLVYKENINLVNSRLEETSGAYFSCGNIKVIVLDKSKVENSNEEKEVLTEELAHYYCNATYKFNSDINFINKQEYRARKLSYNILIPYEDLKLAIKNGVNDLYSLADYFSVTAKYMRNAIEFYQEKFGEICYV